MNIILHCEQSTEKSTLGSLSIEGSDFTCMVLQDISRGLTQNTPVSDILRQKALHPKQVAIPTGTYEVAYTYSDRFKKMMPLLLNVPGFTGVRIHTGNTDTDTEACLIFGTKSAKPDYVENSRVTWLAFMTVFVPAVQLGKVWIKILPPAQVS